MIQTQLKTVVAWFIDNPALAAAIIALLTGGVQAIRTYLRTGNLPLYTLPWRAMRRVFHELRKRFFTTPWPEHSSKELPANDLAKVREKLARASYWVDWPLSYNYYGEDINASRIYYDASQDYPYRQMHVRVKETANGLQVHCHEEAHPWFHPKAHLKGEEFYDATGWVVDRWTKAGLEPRSFTRGES